MGISIGTISLARDWVYYTLGTALAIHAYNLAVKLNVLAIHAYNLAIHAYNLAIHACNLAIHACNLAAKLYNLAIHACNLAVRGCMGDGNASNLPCPCECNERMHGLQVCPHFCPHPLPSTYKRSRLSAGRALGDRDDVDCGSLAVGDVDDDGGDVVGVPHVL